MKQYKYDLHIHSALSPCADRLMSPNNILNMAHLVDLDIIAITDHNSLKQTFVCNELSKSYNYLFIFGVEVTTSEGLHVLCYVQNEEFAKKMDLLLEKSFLDKPQTNPNNQQTIYDEYDNELYQWNQLLHEQSRFDIMMLREIVDELQGIMILAHIERYNERLVSYVKANKDLFHGIEINANQNMNEIINHIPWLKYCNVIRNSDSHQLLEIGRHNNSVSLNRLSIEALFDYFRGYEHD
jgi:PHP family Zn ribbon phosphoesterase